MDNIYYIVSITPEHRNDFRDTSVHNNFCGKIVNQTKDALYFELNASHALVIIPHEWIEFMAPSAKLNKTQESISDET